MNNSKIQWPSLPKETQYPHVTWDYVLGKENDHAVKEWIKNCMNFLGDDVAIMGHSYGNDGKNEGIAVEICKDCKCKILYCGAEVPHITISTSEGAKAVNTAFLKFSRRNFTPFIITGKFGFYMEDGTIAYSILDIFDHGNVVYVGVFFDKETLHNMSPETRWDYAMAQIERLNPNAD